jgi:hypothetical protein
MANFDWNPDVGGTSAAKCFGCFPADQSEPPGDSPPDGAIGVAVSLFWRMAGQFP